MGPPEAFLMIWNTVLPTKTKKMNPISKGETVGPEVSVLSTGAATTPLFVTLALYLSERNRVFLLLAII